MSYLLQDGLHRIKTTTTSQNESLFLSSRKTSALYKDGMVNGDIYLDQESKQLQKDLQILWRIHVLVFSGDPLDDYDILWIDLGSSPSRS